MKVLTGASVILQAAHYAPDGRLHGHTYEIIAWWDDEPCALDVQKRLSDWVSQFDHGILPTDMSRAEDIGRKCLIDLQCLSVDVNRPLERIFAKVIG